MYNLHCGKMLLKMHKSQGASRTEVSLTVNTQMVQSKLFIALSAVKKNKSAPQIRLRELLERYSFGLLPYSSNMQFREQPKDGSLLRVALSRKDDFELMCKWPCVHYVVKYVRNEWKFRKGDVKNYALVQTYVQM